MESWPFKVVDEGGNPKVEVQYLGETKQFSAQEISAMVLVKVRATNPYLPCVPQDADADGFVHE